MHSIRAKITLISSLSITIAILITAIIGCVYIANFGHESVEQELMLLCDTGESNLDYYFKSVEQSVKTVSKIIDSDLDNIDDANYNTDFAYHMLDARRIFSEAAKNANGVLTYYYRIDPSISDVTNEKGFWFVLEDKDFVEHEVTDISDDKNECKWFFEPKEQNKPVWLPPYATDNLGAIVVSYNVPVYRKGSFVGVVGIEIGYHTIGEQIKEIKVLNSGFAFIVENETGSIVYHPYIDILAMPEEERPNIPSGFLDAFMKNEHHVIYNFQGVDKHGYWMELSNNMSIVVSVPLSEITNTWGKVVWQIVAVTFAILVVVGLFTGLYSKQITKPLKELTLAAKQINDGNYNVDLKKRSNDEIGELTDTMGKLVDHLAEYIQDLNTIAYSDALTKVKNKSSFDKSLAEIQEQLDNKELSEFAIVMLDCDGLKDINDKYGHDKGDIYLKNSSTLMCLIFAHSDIYRIGGDEFAVILTGEDYKNRDKLRKAFIKRSKDACSFAKEDWERIEVSLGVATYDKDIDKNANDVLIYADHIMYENKRSRKKKPSETK